MGLFRCVRRLPRNPLRRQSSTMKADISDGGALQDPHVNPLPEDRVTFRIATDVRGKRAGAAVGTATAQHAGRRAVEARAGSSCPAAVFADPTFSSRVHQHGLLRESVMVSYAALLCTVRPPLLASRLHELGCCS